MRVDGWRATLSPCVHRAATHLLLTAMLLGCSSGSGERSSSNGAPSASEPGAPPPPSGPDPFVYATVTERTAPVPERFSAKLPVLSAETEWPETAPPKSYVVAALCHGGDRVREAFVESLEEAAGKATSLKALEPYWKLFEECKEVDEGRCAWAAGVATSERPLLVRQAMAFGVVGCSPQHEPVFDRPDAPVDAVLSHIETPERRSRRNVLPAGPPRARRAWPRLVTAATEGEGGDEKELKRIIHALWLGGDTSVRDFVRAKYRELPEGEKRADYGRAGCAWRGDADADKACALHCAASQAQECLLASSLHNWVWPTDLSLLFCGGNDLDGLDIYAADQREKLADRLAYCIVQPLDAYHDTPSNRRLLMFRRLTLLGVLDFAKARRVASDNEKLIDDTLSGGARPDEMVARVRKQVALLTSYGSRNEALGQLRALGLKGSWSEDARGLTIEDLLEEGGLASTIQRQGGSPIGCFGPPSPGRHEDPIAHDLMARRITGPIASKLDGVVFEQKNGAEPTLLAYFDGRVFETRIAPRRIHTGELYDLDAVVGLVNAVLRARRAQERVAVTSTMGPYEAVVAAADGDAIRRAYEAKLIDVVDLHATEGGR